MSIKLRIKKSFLALMVMAFALSAIAADCDGNVVQDPDFRQWCGNTLCAWNLDSGHIAKAPTWSEIDYGVSFLDTPTQISQDTDESSAKCLVFTSVADIDPAAQVSILVDFDADGVVDYTAPLTGTKFQAVKAEITAPLSYYRIRFMIQKLGTGRAVLAQMRIQSASNCTAPPVVLAPLALGEICASDADCSAGHCGSSFVRRCGQCAVDADCPSGQACASRPTTQVFAPPLQCAPGMNAGIPDAPCLFNSDCKSGACVGAITRAEGNDDGGTIFISGDAGTCDFSNPNQECTTLVGGRCK